MAVLRVYDLVVEAKPPPHLRVFDLFVGPPPVGTVAKLRVFDLFVEGVTPLADQTVESLDVVTIPTPTSQIGGPTVTLSGSGGTRTFVAPSSVDGVNLTFNISGQSLLIAVRAHQWFANRSGNQRAGKLQKP